MTTTPSKPATKSYEPSSPALHAANVLFRNYEVSELGRIEATVHNLAVIIDACTQIFRFDGLLTQLTKAIPWSQESTLVARIDHLREAVEALQAVQKKLPRYEGAPPSSTAKAVLPRQGYQSSAPAVYAARGLLQNFRFTRKGNLAATERNIAIIVDVCTEIFRVEREVYRLASVVRGQSSDDLRKNLGTLKTALRAIELVRNRMPRRSSQTRVIIRESSPRELPFTRSQQAEARRISQAVASARTIEEQQRLLIKAGIVRYGS